MLEPCQRCFYTFKASYERSLEADDCHIHSVRYDMVLERVELAAVSDASSGHLRRCNDADTTNKCLIRVKDASIRSRPALKGHLRRCSDADTTNKCLSRVKDASILSRPAMKGH
eukprot:scaffold4257_cov80-Skeletonema_dohrnii-CCMP3373.AAC.3